VLCTALKPQGLCSEDLAELAYRFALGGIDVIKDDHGIANQDFSTFRTRVKHTMGAVRRANAESGGNTVYAPNVSGAFGEIRDRAIFARENGAGALLVSPGLTGFDTMRALSADDAIALPVIAHPAMLGSYVISPGSGISHYALFGQMARMAGADASIFPNFGGRFSFSPEECRSIAEGCMDEMGPYKSIFPAPGGGMSLDRVPGMMEIYGDDVMFLIGGGLFQCGDDLVENCLRFRKLVTPLI
jgi:ribulose-bisphosphate carboxylase large chain